MYLWNTLNMYILFLKKPLIKSIGTWLIDTLFNIKWEFPLNIYYGILWYKTGFQICLLILAQYWWINSVPFDLARLAWAKRHSYPVSWAPNSRIATHRPSKTSIGNSIGSVGKCTSLICLILREIIHFLQWEGYLFLRVS